MRRIHAVNITTLTTVEKTDHRVKVSFYILLYPLFGNAQTARHVPEQSCSNNNNNNSIYRGSIQLLRNYCAKTTRSQTNHPCLWSDTQYIRQNELAQRTKLLKRQNGSKTIRTTILTIPSALFHPPRYSGTRVRHVRGNQPAAGLGNVCFC